jgi:hypothetical protein
VEGKKRKDYMEACRGIWNNTDRVTYLCVCNVETHSALLVIKLVAPMHAVNVRKGVEAQLQPFLIPAVQRGERSASQTSCFIPAERAVGTS